MSKICKECKQKYKPNQPTKRERNMSQVCIPCSDKLVLENRSLEAFFHKKEN